MLLPFGRLWYSEPNAVSNAIGLRKVSAAAHIDAVIRVYDDAGNVIETHEHAGDFKEPHGGSASPTSPGSNAPIAIGFEIPQSSSLKALSEIMARADLLQAS